MTREVYSDRDFIKFSRSQVFMRVFVDTDPEGKELARKFGLKVLPTLVILDSKGKEIDRIMGGMTAQELIETLEFIFESAEDGSISI